MYHFSMKVDKDIELVQPEVTYAEALFNVLDQNRLYLREYLSFIDYVKEVEHETQFIKMMLTRQAEGTGRLFLIFINGSLQGTIDLHAISNEHKKAEIGYWISKSYSGKGITTKAVRSICDFGFNTLGLNKISLIADTENQGSNKVALKSGFTFVCTDVEDIMHYGTLRDMNRYALLKKDFNNTSR
ncbi:N-acetyltransferase [Macrococcoides caseolyticum]|uniref:GNAT family N-acetyltransferase n=1 Tax=Macrococcoides caseolyticum TaxID=69966 RepID=UPI00105EFC68|nr:GNAT family protein [Macrococcus caseolyticus]TDM25829.1 N-acetyltransferase [Macrococcus caseolyticus]